MYRLCSYMFSMSTIRRTDEHILRQAISEILEQTYAIEYSMAFSIAKAMSESSRGRRTISRRCAPPLIGSVLLWPTQTSMRMRRQTSLKLLSKRSRLNRRNHTFEQLGHTFRERSADDVDSPLPAEIRSLLRKLASAEPRPALNGPTDPPNLRSSAATRSRG
jgi:hypothetical protein